MFVRSSVSNTANLLQISCGEGNLSLQQYIFNQRVLQFRWNRDHYNKFQFTAIMIYNKSLKELKYSELQQHLIFLWDQ